MLISIMLDIILLWVNKNKWMKFLVKFMFMIIFLKLGIIDVNIFIVKKWIVIGKKCKYGFIIFLINCLK